LTEKSQEFSEYIRNEHRNVKFAVAGGRHSYGSFSYGGKTTSSPPYTGTLKNEKVKRKQLQKLTNKKLAYFSRSFSYKMRNEKRKTN
jgi:hypothetical protein